VIRLTLPYPPSTNRIWKNYRGRSVLSKEARDFKNTVTEIAFCESIEPMQGEIALTLDVYRPRRVGDLSNRCKIVEDALNGLAWADDKQIVWLLMRRHEDKANPRVVVTIEEAK
jgi:crossover junction endodeoxyribonuclease RusA